MDEWAVVQREWASVWGNERNLSKVTITTDWITNAQWINPMAISFQCHSTSEWFSFNLFRNKNINNFFVVCVCAIVSVTLLLLLFFSRHSFFITSYHNYVYFASKFRNGQIGACRFGNNNKQFGRFTKNRRAHNKRERKEKTEDR